MNVSNAYRSVETRGWLRAKRTSATSTLTRWLSFVSAGGRRAAPGIVLIVGAVLAGPIQAEDALRTELAVVAKGIAEAVKGLGHEAIAVGEFTGPAQLAASGGPAIAKTLAEELPKHGLAVKKVAQVGVKGEFEDVKDKQSGLLAARIKGTVTDRSGQVLFTFSRGVFSETVLAALFGTTAKLPADLPPAERNAQLEKSLDKPKVHIEGSRVSAAADSPFAMEILAAPHQGAKYQPRSATVVDGLAFVPLSRGEVFAVRLINKSSHEAAVTLTIDGLNLYAFSDVRNPKTGRPRYTVVLVGPGQEETLFGWHRNNEVSEEFVITEYAKSAAAELKSTAATGTVTASFAAAWPKDTPPPADEPASPSANSRSGDAVGRGAQIAQKFVEVKRDIGVVRATVSVRYTK
jgi:hypothetical protein